FSVLASTIPEPATNARYGGRAGSATAGAGTVALLPRTTVKIATPKPTTARAGNTNLRIIFYLHSVHLLIWRLVRSDRRPFLRCGRQIQRCAHHESRRPALGPLVRQPAVAVP